MTDLAVYLHKNYVTMHDRIEAVNLFKKAA
jgi:hypothetical protein